ncbi:MAG TPA: transposase [Planktothrix sp.]|jgi:transposase
MANRKQQKPTYNQEFRETAIKLALAGDKSIAEVARELDLPEWKLYGWVQSWRKKNEKGSGKGSDEELRKLQKRNKELEQENEILKKAAAYFAKTLL